ncbi:MAG TPA: acetyl-CoA carboxylase carboxyl transferase subunit beta [Deltaproteobacteria bacterium]|nr:MAG: acetyl-CoA carboxylase subunit beta [Deltaproteobacteria bacterium GWA2_55_82]OGQ62774.1 MAG: acetyl-CoA carboxylase subunit beta [Deltaproteobacteria bacterium RIFCSPLOWO2_02_FULL_55_12]OIJ73492.1 MAG: acetyl-CoA carboxylase subunit beta [Deltaproteobacteria bacterium GWC2_55_46]HBG46220.1 acetyl-CoA carboxylase carboxyl transferase subunit beta [Deltaproteobacteria bacterium]HCY10127.1 acetyl-CoA carboxylase carboxyl transferase subunit beta [Deltaproteobacteria bacterium]
MIWFKKDLFTNGEESKSVKVPYGLWVKCDHCGEIIYKKEVERNLDVCPKCDYHFRISARARIEITFDEGTFREFDERMEPVDALEFRDLKKYKDRIKASQKETGLKDAMITGEGLIGGQKASAAVFEFSFMGGSMGSVVGEKITRAIERGIESGSGVVIFSSSGGARMQESILSLMQMAKTSAALAKLREACLPYISVLTDPTMGGVSASFAMLGDVIIAEPRALVGFAGPRVIAETIRQKLPEGFQRAEYLLDHGMLDMIVERKLMKETISKLLSMLNPRCR